jgi:hypothetical protein
MEMRTMYTNERAYCFLSDAEKAALVDAQKEGQVSFMANAGFWLKLHRSHTKLYSTSIYRIHKPRVGK